MYWAILIPALSFAPFFIVLLLLSCRTVRCEIAAIACGASRLPAPTSVRSAAVRWTCWDTRFRPEPRPGLLSGSWSSLPRRCSLASRCFLASMRFCSDPRMGCPGIRPTPTTGLPPLKIPALPSARMEIWTNQPSSTECASRPTCYGLAVLFVAEGLSCPPGVGGDLWTLIVCPVSGAMIGVGTGELYGRRWLGAMIGFASGLLIQPVIPFSGIYNLPPVPVIPR